MATPEEYAALPRSIQRKYFSSVERLRITQETAARQRKRQGRKHTWLLSSSSAGLLPRPQSARELRSPPGLPNAAHRVGARSPHPSVDSDQIAWFSSLPEKVRRQHFSKEEHAVLTAECEKLRYESRSDAAGRLLPTRPLLFHGYSAPEARPVKSTKNVARTPNHCAADTRIRETRESCSTVDTDMGIFKLYFRKHSTVPPTTTIIPPPSREPSPLPPPPAPTAAKLKRKSYHRALALTPLALPPPTLAPLPTLPSPSPVTTTARLSRPYIDLPPPLTESYSEPTYYQDPGARKQLREYLGSRHRFSEAIEFGFPSPQSPPPSSASTDGSFPIQRASSPSSTDRDDASVQSEGPSTPTAPPPSRTTRKPTPSASFDSGIVLPLQLNNPERLQRSRSSSNLSGREMTLHLTLTRPELRVSEDRLYSWQRTQTSGVAAADSDPLALEPLPINEDCTGAHGAFAGQGSGRRKGLGRVWKSMRRR